MVSAAAVTSEARHKMTGGDRHRVAVVALEDVQVFDLGIPSRIFGAAYCDDQPLYEVLTCGVHPGPVYTSAGFPLTPGYGLELLHTADSVVVLGPRHGSVLRDGVICSELADALRAAAWHARLISICTGTFVLAAAGLLDHRSATTHWWYADRFRTLFPQVVLDPGVLFMDDGDVLTSAGAAAGVDLCLHVVRKDHGSEVANDAARRCVVPPWRPGGQSQFIERPLPELPDMSTSPTRAWALEHLDEPLTLRQMAAHARMSIRTFTRRFHNETGASPNRWLLVQRVERARHLLESSELSVEQVATEAGFGTSPNLRRHMHATIGVTPTAYRQTFRMSA